MAVPPDSAIPRRTPSDSAGPEGRLSRPTAMTGALPKRAAATLPKARPSARAKSGVSSRSTRPRTSYCRNIDFGTFMANQSPGLTLLPGDRCACLGQRSGTLHGRVEHFPGPDAKDEYGEERQGDDSGGRREEPHIALQLVAGSRLHVHGHDHRQIIPG